MFSFVFASESLYHVLFNCSYTLSFLVIPTFNFLLVYISSLFSEHIRQVVLWLFF